MLWRYHLKFICVRCYDIKEKQMNNFENLPVVKLIWISAVLGFLLLVKERNSGMCLNLTDLTGNISTNDSFLFNGTILKSIYSADVTNQVMNTTNTTTSEQIDTDDDNQPNLHSSYSQTNYDNSSNKMNLSDCCNNNNTFDYNLILCSSAEVKCIVNNTAMNHSSTYLNIFLMRKNTTCYNNLLDTERNMDSSLLKNCVRSDNGVYLRVFTCQNISTLCDKIDVNTVRKCKNICDEMNTDNKCNLTMLLRENITNKNESEETFSNVNICHICFESDDYSLALHEKENQSCLSLEEVIRNMGNNYTLIREKDNINNSTCGNRTHCLDEELNGSTRQPYKVGDVCNNTAECNIPFTECKNNSCICRVGYKNTSFSCTEIVLGDPCTFDEDCSLTNFSICRNLCVCKSQYIPSQYINGSTNCKSRDIGDICNNTEDCNETISNAECLNGHCTCKTGHKHFKSTNISWCILISLFDDCGTQSDCYEAIENSHCFNSTCSCFSGYAATGTGSCEKRRAGIHQCITDKDCYDSVNMSYCHENFTCDCHQGYISSSNGSICRPLRLFDDCFTDDDCQVTINNSYCHGNICRCLSGYHGNHTCQRRHIYDECYYNTDCVDAVHNSICLNNSCLCKTGFLVSVDKSYCIKRTINDTCNADTDCSSVVNNSLCEDDICSCKTGYDVINNRTQCVKRPSNIGEPCYFQSQCVHIDVKALCDDTCICPEQHFVSENSTACTLYPRKLDDQCSSHYQCVSAVKYSTCSKGKICQCMGDYFSDNRKTLCRKYPVKIAEKCLTNDHCRNIEHTRCLRNSCLCTYKFEASSDRSTCIPRRRISYPKPTNIWLGGLCNIKDETPCPQWNITNQVCSREDGRVNTRCRCRSGFANIYNAGDCHEIQTYFIRLNITEELGCYKKEIDKPRCYTFSAITYMKQYSNNNTGIYRDMKLRIQILGLYNAYNTTDLWSRFVSSEVINMTEIPNGIQVNAVLHIDEDFYDVMDASVFSDVLIHYLRRNKGVLGDSYLKVAQPYNKNIYTDDFHECLDWNSRVSDCSPFAWCINTYGSYMCSCRYEYKDVSFDTSDRPGRICIPEVKKKRYSQSCSDGKCETNWIWMGLSLSLLLFLLISFLVHEIFSKKKEIQKFHPTYIPVKKAPSKPDKDKLITEDDNLINKEIDTFDSDIEEDPPVYTMEP